MKNDVVTGKARGGLARAQKLSAEERSDIARKAAIERWSQDRVNLPRATHSGKLNLGDIEFQCVVLNDGTRVFSGTGFMKGMGMYRSGALSVRRKDTPDGAQIPLFLAYKNLKPFIDNDLIDVLKSPLEYYPLRGKRSVNGIKAEAIPKICDVWLRARDAGVLKATQLTIAAKADIIMRALAQVGIIALIDEATGYQEIRPRDALQAYLDMLIRKELAAWAKKFPDEFYRNIYELKGWPWPGMGKNRYSIVAHYTIDLVYMRIAPGLLEELQTKSPKNEKGYRKNKLHQWLTEDIGDPMLAQHLHSLVMFQRLALANGFGWNRFLRMVDQVLPKKGSNMELPFMKIPLPIEPLPPSEQ